DLPPLLALAAVAVGIAMLAMAEREVTSSPQEGSAGSVLPGLADGYVLAVALLVIGWSTLFSAEFHRSGERPGTFLLALVHPLADLAVLGALLPMVTTAWRRVTLPYLSLLAIAVGDALAVGQRGPGGHLGVAGQLMPVAAGWPCWPGGSSCWYGGTWPCWVPGASPAGACATWPTGPATSSWSAIWTAWSSTRARPSRTTATRRGR